MKRHGTGLLGRLWVIEPIFLQAQAERAGTEREDYFGPEWARLREGQGDLAGVMHWRGYMQANDVGGPKYGELVK
jgi:hypothetical protein